MAKGKLIALAGVGMLAMLLVSSGAQAATDLTIRAGGVLFDGTGFASGSANVMVTVPDGPDVNELPDPVGGILIEYWIGDVQVPCDPEIATTDPSGVARCGLGGNIADLLANGGRYQARFAGNELYNPGADDGSLIYNANAPNGGDLP